MPAPGPICCVVAVREAQRSTPPSGLAREKSSTRSGRSGGVRLAHGGGHLPPRSHQVAHAAGRAVQRSCSSTAGGSGWRDRGEFRRMPPPSATRQLCARLGCAPPTSGLTPRAAQNRPGRRGGQHADISGRRGYSSMRSFLDDRRHRGFAGPREWPAVVGWTPQGAGKERYIGARLSRTASHSSCSAPPNRIAATCRTAAAKSRPASAQKWWRGRGGGGGRSTCGVAEKHGGGGGGAAADESAPIRRRRTPRQTPGSGSIQGWVGRLPSQSTSIDHRDAHN